MTGQQQEGAYPCPKCTKRFNSQTHWHTHMKLHKNPTLYQCPICKKNFTGPSTLKCHIMTHTGVKPYPCPKCSMFFTQKANMMKHFNTHSNIRQFPCHICGKAFTRKAHLQGHVSSVHEKRKDHLCPICGMKFSTIYTKKKHYLTHLKRAERNRLSCHYCLRTFLTSLALENHLRVHTREKPFQCIAPTCRRAFLNQARLKTHLSRSHRDHSNILKDCYFCGRLFSTTSMVKQHLLTHTTERPFPCGVDMCKWAFRGTNVRKKHIKRVHGNAKPYSESRPIVEATHSVDKDDSEPNFEKITDKSEICVINVDPVKMETAAADAAPAQPDHRLPFGSSRIIRKQRLKCAFCGVIYSTKIELFTHMNSDHGANIKCRKKTPSIYTKYTTSKKEMCYFCHKSLTLPSLANHTTGHTKEVQEKCEGCGKKFRNMPALRYHWSKSCTTLSTRPKKTYSCKFCPKIYNAWNSLVNHMRRIHLGEDNDEIDCFIRCGSTFSTTLKRDEHMKMNHKKDLKCPQVGCEETFYTKRLVNFHLLEFHKDKNNNVGRQPYKKSKKCLICMICFKTPDDLISHFGEVHKSINIVSKPQNKGCKWKARSSIHRSWKTKTVPKKRKVRKMKCYFCHRAMPLTSLRTHVAIHTEESHFKCEEDECGKNFRKCASVRKHFSQIHGNKDKATLELDNQRKGLYKCGICRCRFLNQSQLSGHMQHTHFSSNLSKRVAQRPEKLKFDVDAKEKSSKKRGKRKRPASPNSNVSKDLPPYKCSKCDLQFKSKYKVRNHELRHIKPEERREMFKCDQCTKSFLHPTTLSSHKKYMHNDNMPPTCSTCGKSFSGKTALKFHIQTIHETFSKDFICSICSLNPPSFKTQVGLNRHVQNVHSLKSFSCPKCRRSFSIKSSLQVHMETHINPKERTYVECTQCGKSMLPRSMFEHMRTIHSKNGNCYPCTFPNCTKSFPSKSYLDTHIPRHSEERKFPCPLCYYRAKSKSDLRYHLSIHTGEKPWMCDTCGTSCRTHSILATHIRMVHERIRKPIKKAVAVKCYFCEKILSGAASLRGHMIRKNFNERPYTCQVCSFRGNNRTQAQDHFSQHHGDNSYPCPQCDSVFKVKKNLRQHTRLMHGSPTANKDLPALQLF